MANYPTTNLQPGSQGSAVKQLQDYLVSNGYMTQAEVDTGYGVYGPKTTAAVKKLQASLGVDNSSGPGYWGPKTIAKVSQSTSVPPENTNTGGGTKTETKTDTTTETKTGTGTGTGIDTPVPASVAFKNTEAYKSLSQELKDFVDLSYNLVEVGGEDDARNFANAIDQAKAIAEPYFKAQLSLAKAEVLSNIAEKTSDYQTKAEVIQRTRDELLQDVSINKDQLTLEQQAELATAARGYDEDLLTIADQAAEKGITFATGYKSRNLAETRRGEQYKDVIQSSQRTLNFKIKELELKAARGDVAAQKELAALQTTKSFDLQQIGRSAEEVLGSANMPTVEGYTPTRNVLGTLEEKKQKSMTSDIAAFFDLQKGLI
jgi:peptidoglycan hydrolase-like protein with peptidoglycan-binding domain